MEAGTGRRGLRGCGDTCGWSNGIRWSLGRQRVASTTDAHGADPPSSAAFRRERRSPRVSFWYNVDTGQVETDENRSRGEQVLGPYPTEAAARAALDSAHKRTEQWDAEDRDWNERGGAAAGPGDTDD